MRGGQSDEKTVPPRSAVRLGCNLLFALLRTNVEHLDS